MSVPLFTVVVSNQDEDNGWIYHYHWVDLDVQNIPRLGGEYL